MTSKDRTRPPEPKPDGAAPGNPPAGAEAAKDNKYGRSSAEATDLTRKARQEAREDGALLRATKTVRKG